SDLSKQILKSAQLSASLPVNTLIYGQMGVGKKLLSAEILPNSTAIKANELEKLIISNQINLSEYNSLIIYEIDNVINLEQFLNSLQNIKLVATSLEKYERLNNLFTIKIEIPPLESRKEDLDELISVYTKEASHIYKSNNHTHYDLKIDLSQNGITLKQSIYKSILLQSITKQEMMDTLEIYLLNQLKEEKTYKQLLEVFEIPLLKASKKAFKSQLKMSQKLDINRITLRKKLHKYFEET
ncbi:MAG: Fis family transcriptional regulator, partial [Arcobacteraceae bacterium]|nr:Fis family transcriptional regulator [Arcobacteraceae bacterium]